MTIGSAGAEVFAQAFERAPALAAELLARGFAHARVPSLLRQRAAADLHPHLAERILQDDLHLERLEFALRFGIPHQIAFTKAPMAAGRPPRWDVAAVSPGAHGRRVDTQEFGRLLQA